MLKKYLELLKSILEGISKSKGPVSFSDYFEVIKCTFILLGYTIGSIVVLFLVFMIPLGVYRKMKNYYEQRLNELYKELSKKETPIDETKQILEKQYKRAKIIYWSVFIIIYIPIAIPTILLLVDVIISIF